MKRKIILMMILTAIFIVNCKNVNKNNLSVRQNPPILIQDFEDFFEVFKKAVRERDKRTIERLAGDNFRYVTDDERDKLSRIEAIEQFDFELAEKLIIEGYEETLRNKIAYIPPVGKMNKYGFAMSIRNKKDGWQLISIYKGPVEDLKQ